MIIPSKWRSWSWTNIVQLRSYNTLRRSWNEKRRQKNDFHCVEKKVTSQHMFYLAPLTMHIFMLNITFQCFRMTEDVPVIVHSSFRHSSRLLVIDNEFCISARASNNGNITAPIIAYAITNSTRPGVENTIRNNIWKQRFEFHVDVSVSITKSFPSFTCSASDIFGIQSFTNIPCISHSITSEYFLGMIFCLVFALHTC